MAGHAILSPSGFKALMLCPAKPAMERGIKDRSSGYADEGTLAHEVAAAVLTGAEPPSHSREMREFVDIYVDYIRDLMTENLNG